MTSADEPTNDKKPPSRKSRLSLLVVTVVLLLSFMAVGWQLAREWFQPAEQVAAAEESLVLLRAFERRLATLEHRVGQLTELAAARDNPVRVIESNQMWWLAEIERYLAEASERVNAGGDVKAALSALKATQHTLGNVDTEGVSAAALDALGEILHVEIQLLEDYRNHAAMRALMLIDNMLEKFGRSASTAAERPEATGTAVSGSHGGTWDNLLERFRHLVVIETSTQDELQQANEGLVVYSLILARTAILGEDSRAFHHAISNAKQLLEQSGVFDRATHDDLQVLQSLDIAPKPPYIGRALEEMRTLVREMKS